MNSNFETFCSETDEKEENSPENKVWKEPLDFISNPEQEAIILKKISNPENYLGEGGAAMVFDLDGNRCAKLMKNRHNSHNAHMYDLGNSPRDEAGIQNILKDFRVAGVFAPNILSEFHGAESSVIIMEKLDAVNLQLILNQEEEMPAGFNLEDFFKNLKEFIGAMHDKKGIAHADLESRNIMVDKKTACPRVIDFGRAKVRDRQTRRDFMLAAKGDLDNLDKMREKLKNHFQEKK
jgi:tRNA A-37 threonylcarbamoyl transferase component Bud32